MDEEGQHLVRNCSCRGNDAGYAHLSCLVKYAEQKCKQACERDMAAFSVPWKICTNCKQSFQGQLSIDMASAFISFTETTYGHPGNSKDDKVKVLFSHRMMILILDKIQDITDIAHCDIDGNPSKDTIEREKPLRKLLSMVDQTKLELKMNSWVHLPKDSEEYGYYRLLCGDFEAFAYDLLGDLISARGYITGKGIQSGIFHYKKARAIYSLVSRKDKAKFMDNKISTLSGMLQAQEVNPDAFIDGNSIFQGVKKNFEDDLNTHGMNSEVTIGSGLSYARLLLSLTRRIEAERIVTKVATASLRVHGPGHKTTCEAEMLAKECKERRVSVLPDCKEFQVLRYKSNGNICVVTGPITKPRLVEDERLYRVANKLVIPGKGCPVICHGLVSASHLNGELGEVRDFKDNEVGLRLVVYFEKKGAKPSLVKLENLRIVFELPDEK